MMTVKNKFHNKNMSKKPWDTGSMTWRRTSPTSSRQNKITIMNKIMKKPRCRTCRTSRTTITTIRRRRKLLTRLTIIMNQWTLKKCLFSCTTPTTILLDVRKKNSSQDQVIPVDKIIRKGLMKMIIIATWTRPRSSPLNLDALVKTSR